MQKAQCQAALRFLAIRTYHSCIAETVLCCTLFALNAMTAAKKAKAAMITAEPVKSPGTLESAAAWSSGMMRAADHEQNAHGLIASSHSDGDFLPNL